MPRVQRISALEPEMQKLSDEQLRARTAEFRARIQQKIAEAQASQGSLEEEEIVSTTKPKRDPVLEAALDEVLEEAFAVVREVGRRVLNMRHFDVQLIGGMVLHQGKISEMKTGEGKTLVATLPVYLKIGR